MKNRSAQRGFTLIELLVVIGILAILLSIVLIAINPARQFGQANDTKRQSSVTQILNAVGAYHADHAGQLPATLNAGTTSALMITNDAAYDGAGASVALPAAGDTIDLCTEGVSPTYIPALPVDPGVVVDFPSMDGVEDIDCDNPGTYVTGYVIWVDGSGRITVEAPYADIATPIRVTR